MGRGNSFSQPCRNMLHNTGKLLTFPTPWPPQQFAYIYSIGTKLSPLCEVKRISSTVVVSGSHRFFFSWSAIRSHEKKQSDFGEGRTDKE